MVSGSFLSANVLPKYDILEGRDDEQAILCADMADLTPFRRIRALRDFGDVKAGDIGGFVQGDKALSHEGNCWIYDDAKVYSTGQIKGSAQIRNGSFLYRGIIEGDSVVRGYAKCDDVHISGRTTLWMGQGWKYPMVYGKAHDVEGWIPRTVDEPPVNRPLWRRVLGL